MADDGQPPVLNPVLALRKEARPEGVTGGGKQPKHIRADRLPIQQKKLVSDLRKMFDDSLATSFTPSSLLIAPVGCQLLVPVADGYVFEIALTEIPKLIQAIEAPTSIGARVDISRIAAIDLYGDSDVLHGRSVEALWNAAMPEHDGRLFMAWLAPFRDARARAELMMRLELFSNEGKLLPTYPDARLIDSDRGGQRLLVSNEPDQTSIAGVLRRYRNTGHGAASVRLTSKDQLSNIVASGLVHRIEPVRAIRVTSAGVGREPGPPPPDVSRAPIVGIVDGGMTAASYRPAEVWKAAALIPDSVADTVHGNKVASIVVQGHAWNSNLRLPKLFCRFGTAQAVPKEDVEYPLNTEQLVVYIENLIADHPETRVWNLSFNERHPIDSFAVSFLGHSLAKIARKLDVLLVISGGNKLERHEDRIQPPADCEAALVVGGRNYDGDGGPGDACMRCAPGLAPEEGLKPDVSWFSPLRVIGGTENYGSSFPTGLVSALSAHTFENLRNPSPDVVRALLINTTEREKHDRRLGWGTPYQGSEPWQCQPGSVTLLWSSKLRARTAYYWEGIPIPEELIREGKLFGEASLTAILKPLTREEGDANYFITRVQVSLQFQQGATWKSLLGSMKEDTEAEQTARNELAKWYPVRRHRRDFSKRNGLQFDPGSTMRVFARVFSRDLYQLDLPDNADLGEHDVAFALTFSNGGDDSKLYNAMRANLGAFVESAVVESDIEIDGDA
jgi:hypothetical protein